MRIAFDLDGTAWKYRELFSTLSIILKNGGVEVGILTAHNISLKDADKHLWKARGFSIPVDFYIARTEEDKELSAVEWKLKMVEKNSIDLLIDDMHGFKDVFCVINKKYQVRD